jgi:hypothetical protein
MGAVADARDELETLRRENARLRKLLKLTDPETANSAAVIRLVGAVQIDMHDEWIVGDRRYLSEGSMAKPYDTSDNGDHAAIDSGEQAPRITSKPTTPLGSVDSAESVVRRGVGQKRSEVPRRVRDPPR